jgi:acetyltransferase-like isoleucine patch superfamily enzyme
LGVTQSWVNRSFPQAGVLCSPREAGPVAPYDFGEVIAEDVGLGSNVTILCGVTIGEDALVGAASTLMHDVPPASLVLGYPARVVGPRPPG